MLNSCQMFAAALQAAGSPGAELLVSEGMPHGFYFLAGRLSESRGSDLRRCRELSHSAPQRRALMGAT